MFLLFFFFNDTATTEIYTFPYTTLFRSPFPSRAHRAPRRALIPGPRRRRTAGRRHSARSEEHTSELQSQSNLVCRLLLEKKKKNEHRWRGRKYECRCAGGEAGSRHEWCG